MASPRTSARLDVWAGARVLFRHRQNLVVIPEHPMDDGGRDRFCLEAFGAGGTPAVTTAVRKTSGRCPPTIKIEAISVSS